MKVPSCFIVYFLTVIIFGSCHVPTTPRVYKTDVIPSNIILMPYKDNTKLYGYVNSETFEIVIPAQYEYAGSFVNGFAVVAKKWNPYTKYFIINQKNEVIIKNIDFAYIIKSEDRKTTFALTKNNTGLMLDKYTTGDFTKTIHILLEPRDIIYRLYDLSTRKLVWKGKERYISGLEGATIKFFTNYMTFEKELYEIKNNGMFEKKDIGDKEFKKLIAEIVKEKKLENVFNYDDKYSYDDLYNEKLDFEILGLFGGGGMNYIRVETFDFDLLIQNLPENLRLYSFDMWKKGDDWINYVREEWEPFNGSKVSAIAINRDKFQPFLEKTWLFDFNLYPSKGRGGEHYIGIYNASENKWTIPPIEQDTFSDFTLTGYDDLICYTDRVKTYPFFYNIKTREKSEYLYEYNHDKGTIAYMGYYENKNKITIEKF